MKFVVFELMLGVIIRVYRDEIGFYLEWQLMPKTGDYTLATSSPPYGGNFSQITPLGGSLENVLFFRGGGGDSNKITPGGVFPVIY